MNTETPPRRPLMALADRLLGGLAAFVLFGVMLLVATDVAARAFFREPIEGAFELTELGLVILIFAGLPLVSRQDEHVSVDLLAALIPPRLARLLDRVMHLVMALALLGAGWLLWDKAEALRSFGDESGRLKIPYWPFVLFMAALSTVTALIHLVKLFAGARTQ